MSNLREPITKKLSSDWGESVTYVITPWTTSHGIGLMCVLMPVMVNSFKVFKGESFKKLQAGGIDTDLSELFSGVTGDMAVQMASVVSDIARAITSKGDAEFIRDMLVGSRRTCENAKQILKPSLKADFDQIYQANYGELVIAIIHVLTANFGPIFSRLEGVEKK